MIRQVQRFFIANRGPGIIGYTMTSSNDVSAWLEPTEYTGDGSEYEKHLRHHVPGTGEWLFSSNVFKNWLSQENSGGVLWIKGAPGSGKSIIAANTIRYLSNEVATNGPVLFFFFRQSISTNRTPASLVRDLLAQLLTFPSRAATILQAELDRIRGREIQTMPLTQLWKLLAFALAGLEQAFIVVDALDEIQSGLEGFFEEFLLKLGQLRPRTIKLMVTSRPLSHLQAIPALSNAASIRLAGGLINEDVKKYVTVRLMSQDKRMLSEEDEIMICDRVAKWNDHLFLQASLMLDEILGNNKPIKSQLDQLPESLTDLYQGLLDSYTLQPEIDRQLQLQVLTWVTLASRPIRLIELAALLVSQGRFRDIVVAKNAARSCCGPLLEVRPDESVHVCHHSFTEFLFNAPNSGFELVTMDGSFESVQRDLVIDPKESHKALAIACLDYMLSDALPSMDLGTTRLFQKQNTYVEHRFLKYAASHWQYHVLQFGDFDVEIFEKLDMFLMSGDSVSHLRLRFTELDESINTKGLQPLHVAAWFGLTTYAEYRLVQCGDDPNHQSSTGWTPTMMASVNGHKDIVSLLLKHNADPNTHDSSGVSAVHIAALRDHATVLQVLIGAEADLLSCVSAGEGGDADVWLANWLAKVQPSEARSQGFGTSTPGAFGSREARGALRSKTALQLACECGNLAAATVLASHLNSQAMTSVSLHWAARRGHTEILSMLLQYDIIKQGINCRDENGKTALYLASGLRCASAVRVLLEGGADAQALSSGKDGMGFKPKITLAPSKRIKVQQPPSQPMGSTPLHAWAKMGFYMYQPSTCSNVEEMETVAHLLIQAGCNVNQRDENGQTALFAWSNHEPAERFVGVLLQHGADPTLPDNDGNTPLHLIRVNDTEDKAIALLLEAGADINATRPSDGCTPLLTLARRHGHESFDVTRFVSYNADVNRQDKDGNTLLHHLIPNISSILKKSQAESLATSLAVHCDLGIKNNRGEHCLFAFLRSFTIEKNILRTWCSYGIDLEKKNRYGRTVFLEACRTGTDSCINTFVAMRSNVLATDNDGKTCEWGCLAFVCAF